MRAAHEKPGSKDQRRRSWPEDENARPAASHGAAAALASRSYVEAPTMLATDSRTAGNGSEFRGGVPQARSLAWVSYTSGSSSTVGTGTGGYRHLTPVDNKARQMRD